jgi:glycosyltransferase involved in cell wall biosynthesis
MIIGIDASNIKAGGGLTHLIEIINFIDVDYLIDNKVFIVGGNHLDKLILKKNVEIIKPVFLVKNSFFLATIWKLFVAENWFVKNVDIVFTPGGTFYSKKIPYISMSQNMLVFEDIERNRFNSKLSIFRYKILEFLQVRSLSYSSGNIFISDYAKKFISNKHKSISSVKSGIISHGISDIFVQKPKKQKCAEFFSFDRPFKFLYVSIINAYKHQWNVVQAVNDLREEGLPIALDLIGISKKKYLDKLEQILNKTSGSNYLGFVPYNDLYQYYHRSDAFIFASSCENMPNILVEAMSAGLPVVSSNYGPMPEILGDSGIYFDPIEVISIKKAIKKVFLDEKLRTNIAVSSFEKSKKYSWIRCSSETFNFIKNQYETVTS